MFVTNFNDWEQRELGELAEVSSSKRIHLRDYVTKGVPFYRGSEISNGGNPKESELFISENLYYEIKEKYGIPEPGDLLITAVGTLGNIWKVDNREFYYKDGNLIRLSQLKVNSNFILAFFSDGYGKRKLLDSAAGSNQKALTITKMKKITFFLSSKEEQLKIGDFLKLLDDTIALHQEKLEKLKQLKKAYLQVMFPKNGERTPRLRFANFLGDWEQRELSEVVERITRKNKNLESTLPLTISAQGGLINQNDFFNKQVASRDVSNYYLVKKGDFAYNKSYSNGYPWGAVKRLDSYDMGVLSTLYIVFIPIRINSNFLVSYYDTTSWHKEVSKRAAEGARNHGLLNITASDFFKTKLSIPSSGDEQKKIGNFFRQFDDSIALQNARVMKLKKIKEIYLKKLFI